jgi:hypothetical protein
MSVGKTYLLNERIDFGLGPECVNNIETTLFLI